MKINVEITSQETVELSESQLREITRKYLCKRYNINQAMTFEEGNIMHEVEYVTSHKWYSKEKYRKELPLDKEAHLIIADLFNKKRSK